MGLLDFWEKRKKDKLEKETERLREQGAKNDSAKENTALKILLQKLPNENNPSAYIQWFDSVVEQQLGEAKDKMAKWGCTFVMDAETGQLYYKCKKKRNDLEKSLEKRLKLEAELKEMQRRAFEDAENKIRKYIFDYLDEMRDAGFHSVELTIENDLKTVELKAINPSGEEVSFKGGPVDWEYPSALGISHRTGMYEGKYYRCSGMKAKIDVSDDTFLFALKEFIRAFTKLNWGNPQKLMLNRKNRGEDAISWIDVEKHWDTFIMTCFVGVMDEHRIQFKYTMDEKCLRTIERKLLDYPVDLLKSAGCKNISINHYELKKPVVKINGISSFNVGFHIEFEYIDYFQ